VKLSIGATLASHWLMPRLPAFLRAHDHIQLEIITHPFPASVRRREADVVLRPFDTGEENLVGRKIGRLGTGFYASRDYAAGRSLPERRGDWKEHSVIGFADQTSNAQLARWSDVVTRQARVAMRCSSQGDMLAAVRAGIGISALSCFVAEAYSDLVRVAPQKLASVADLWLLAHPDLVELPAVRAVIDFVAECARADRARLRG
ncbi:LysR substrate-binding domain-containing protein, partial [Bradyrhizobium yuanmingense]